MIKRAKTPSPPWFAMAAAGFRRTGVATARISREAAIAKAKYIKPEK